MRKMFRIMRNMFRIMQNMFRRNLPWGIPHHAENSPQDVEISPQDAGNMFQYSASVRNSAYKFRLMRSIGTNFPHHATSFFFFIFLMFDFPIMRKYCSNTPHENFRIKHAEKGVSCGESRYGLSRNARKLVFGVSDLV